MAKIREQSLGKLNYDTFQKVQGIEHAPDFKLLSTHERNAWEAAALAIKKAGSVQTADGDPPNDPNDPDSGPG